MTVICPLCERGNLQSSMIDETIRYNGGELVVPGIEISKCDQCGEEIVTPQQARANEVKFADAKRRIEGLLTSQEIVRWRERHHLTQAEAAKLLGGGINAFSKYERGEVIQSQSMDLLMRCVDESFGALGFLSRRMGVPIQPTADWTVAENDCILTGRLAAQRVTRTKLGVVRLNASVDWMDTEYEQRQYG